MTRAIAVGAGRTRFVVCVGPYAFKIARVPIILMFLRYLEIRRDKKPILRLQRHNGSYLRTIISFMLSGLHANQREIARLRAGPQCAAPALLQTALWGWVLVQERCRPALPFHQAAVYAHGMWGCMLIESQTREGAWRQFGISPTGAVVLLDLGHECIGAER